MVTYRVRSNMKYHSIRSSGRRDFNNVNIDQSEYVIFSYKFGNPGKVKTFERLTLVRTVQLSC